MSKPKSLPLTSAMSSSELECWDSRPDRYDSTSRESITHAARSYRTLLALGSLVAKPRFGVVVSSLVFALLHGTQNLPLFADRLAFGLLAALLVWRTGGLEAGIAAHVINNVFAYLIAGLTTSVAELKGISGIGWVDATFDVAQRRGRAPRRNSGSGSAEREILGGGPRVRSMTSAWPAPGCSCPLTDDRVGE